MGFHDIGHMRPPRLHDVVGRKFVHAVIICTPEDAKKDIRLFVEVDRVIRNTGVFKQRDQIGPDVVMAVFVFVFCPRREAHFKGVLFHEDPLSC